MESRRPILTGTHHDPQRESLRLSVLGRVDLGRGEAHVESLLRRRKPLAVLIYLGMDDSGKYFQRDHLCGIFWPDVRQRRARASLRQALSIIRKLLPDVLDTRGIDEVRVRPGAITSDYHDLLRATAEGRWSDARALDAGEIFQGFHLPGADAFEEWIDGLRAELHTARSSIRESAPQGSEGASTDPPTTRRRPNAVAGAADAPSPVAAGTPAVAPDGRPGAWSRATLLAFVVVVSLGLLAVRGIGGPNASDADRWFTPAVTNPEALASYRRAQSLIGVEGSGSARADRWQVAERHLRAALDADPTFAPAWARLAHLRFRAFWLGADPSSDGIQEGLDALERSRALDPDGPLTRLASAYQAYHVERNWHAAADSARALVEVLDSDPDVTLLWAMAERRRGNFEESARIQQERLARYPQELLIHGPDLHATLRRLGAHAEAAEVRARLAEYGAPRSCWTEYGVVRDRAGFGRELDSLVSTCRRENPGAYFAGPLGFWHAYGMRRYAEALAHVDSMAVHRARMGLGEAEWVNQQWAPFPLDLLRGRAYLQAGDSARARAAFARPIPRLEALRDEVPDLSLRHRFLALAYAGAGRADEALKAAQRARSIALRGGDLWFEIPEMDQDLLEVHVLLANIDEAMELLHAVEEQRPPDLVARLNTDPTLDPLRGDARFAAMLKRVNRTAGAR